MIWEEQELQKDLQEIIFKLDKIFQPPQWIHDHVINLGLESKIPNIRPYSYPFSELGQLVKNYWSMTKHHLLFTSCHCSKERWVVENVRGL